MTKHPLRKCKEAKSELQIAALQTLFGKRFRIWGYFRCLEDEKTNHSNRKSDCKWGNAIEELTRSRRQSDFFILFAAS